ncbi:MAG: GNAT family N-acetyltransferase [Phycisphaerales bacterium]|nr:GNAT family N-acetyltransferase [Phycisphaerales bacterium]
MMWTVRRPADQREVDRLFDIILLSFNWQKSDAVPFIECMSNEQLHVIEGDAGIVGGLYVHDLGQYFGGRCVRMGGVAVVAIHPCARGAGAATHLVNEALRHMRTQGIPISSLFPASQALYRRSGYERAGGYYGATVRAEIINIRERNATLRPITDADAAHIRALHDDDARANDGHIGRNDYQWRKVRTPRGRTAEGYIVEESGTITGYIYLVRTSTASDDFILRATDIVFQTPTAGRALWQCIAQHATVADVVHLNRPADDPVYALLPEQVASIRLKDHWMLRIVDVVGALEARGYPRGIDVTLSFHIDDDVIPENNGPFTMHLRDGSATVAPGGTGEIRIDVRGLAALYAGHQPLRQLCRLGLAHASDEAQARADAAFPAGRPTMPEAF